MITSLSSSPLTQHLVLNSEEYQDFIKLHCITTIEPHSYKPWAYTTSYCEFYSTETYLWEGPSRVLMEDAVMNK